MSPAPLPVWPRLLCGQPFTRRPRSAPMLCRRCVAQRADEFLPTVLATPHDARIRKRRRDIASSTRSKDTTNVPDDRGKHADCPT
jgi:hypothetical protein